MNRRITPIIRFILRKSPKIVRLLERTNEGLEGPMIIVGKNRLEISEMKLLVPPKIEVYHVIVDESRELYDLFYTAKKDDDFGPVYLSRVSVSRGSLNFAKNVEKLLESTWFNHEDSSFVFDRLVRGLKPPIYGIYGLDPHKIAHPFWTP
jgi:hypothetical protein